MDLVITEAVIEITELQNTLLRRKSKETKFGCAVPAKVPRPDLSTL
jgi:hypothetical protein